MMKMAELKKFFEEIGFDVMYLSDDFIEFHGKKNNHESVIFDIEGSMEFERDGKIAYSLNFFNENEEQEFSMTGRICNSTVEAVNDLIVPEFGE